MLKIIFSTILLICSIYSNAQSLSFKDSSLINSGPSISDNISIHDWFYNNSGKTNLKWKRVKNILTTNWGSAICDNTQCYDTGVSEASFTMPNNDSFNFSFYFYAYGIRGNGSMTVCVYSEFDTSISTCVTYSAFGWGAGFQNLTNSMILYPNPANNIVNIDGTIPKTGLINIFDFSGKLIYQQSLELSKNKVNVADIPNGCYTLSIEGANGTMRQKIFVQH